MSKRDSGAVDDNLDDGVKKPRYDELAGVAGDGMGMGGGEMLSLVISSFLDADKSISVNKDISIRALKAEVTKAIGRKMVAKKMVLAYETETGSEILEEKDPSNRPYRISNYNVQDGATISLTLLTGQANKDKDAAVRATGNPDGFQRRNTNNRRWKMEDIMRLVTGVEIFGTYQYSLVKRDFFPPDTAWSAQDLYDKWRNLVKAAEAKRAQSNGEASGTRNFRGITLTDDILNRIINANKVKQNGPARWVRDEMKKEAELKKKNAMQAEQM